MAARPVRRPPSSCLSAAVAPSMRRLMSLRSKVSATITLLPDVYFLSVIQSENRYPLFGIMLVLPGDNRAFALTGQNSADRSRLRDRKHDDRQRGFAGKREGRRVH